MITLEKTGSRIYLVGDTFAVKDRIKSIGGHWDGDRRAWWIGSAKATDAQALVDSLANGGTAVATGERPTQDPKDIRLTGKGEYKGRTYYLGSHTRDGLKVRCLTLPDANGKFLDFWAMLSEVKVVKTYRSREVWDGRRYSNRTVTQYTTLGSIAEFIADQREAKANGEAECAECGKRGGDLVRDLEDGMMKHRHCCDIEP